MYMLKKYLEFSLFPLFDHLHIGKCSWIWLKGYSKLCNYSIDKIYSIFHEAYYIAIGIVFCVNESGQN